MLNKSAFFDTITNVLDAADNDSKPISFAYFQIAEWDSICNNFGPNGEEKITEQLSVLLDTHLPTVQSGSIGHDGRFVLLIQASKIQSRLMLNNLSQIIVSHDFHISSDVVRLTPAIGFTMYRYKENIDELSRQALVALVVAVKHLDLQVVCFSKRLEVETKPIYSVPFVTQLKSALLGPSQIALATLGTIFIPFFMYYLLWKIGLDYTNTIFIATVVVLTLTAIGIVVETLLAPGAIKDPPEAKSYPSASAIIAAYLPNEAATVIDTIEAFLKVNYSASLQIILAYNTPQRLPIENELLAIAKRDPRFVPLFVPYSTSKAQNVNAALSIVSGKFVGVFDADHHPDPNSFTRAWNWLANGYDIVQGHCVIRNGESSLVTQTVAVEFESIYALSHPGRTKMHGFGLFGGSNGYWKTNLLCKTRFHPNMLTEDIDSSLRVVIAGGKIASDPKLISRELAPSIVKALWNQRLRWAQGWFQVSIKHIIPALKSPNLSFHQKVGMVHLLVWRELYIWMMAQVYPIIGFWLFIRHDHLNWFVPVFIATMVFTTIVGPIQLACTYFLAEKSVKQKGWWFIAYMFTTFIVYGEMKNIMSRVAQLKELCKQKAWVVTPRSIPVVQFTSNK